MCQSALWFLCDACQNFSRHTSQRLFVYFFLLESLYCQWNYVRYVYTDSCNEPSDRLRNTKYGTIFQKKSFSTMKLFSLNMFFIRLFLANTEKKKHEGHHACFLTICRVKRWTWFWDVKARRGLGGDTKWCPSCSRYIHSRSSLFLVVCHVFGIANTEINTWKEYNKYHGTR